MARKNRGETLAETLISMLISALSLLLLVTMIQSSAKLITNSETTLKNDTVNINALNHPSDSGDTANIKITFKNADDTGETEFNVAVKYVLDDSGTVPAVSYVKTP